MNDEVLEALLMTFPVRYAVVAERLGTASEREKTEDYLNVVRKQGTLSEYAIFVGHSRILDVLNQDQDTQQDFIEPTNVGLNATWDISIVSYEGVYDGILEGPIFLNVISNPASFSKDVVKAALFVKGLFEKVFTGGISALQFYDIKSEYEAATTLKIKKNNILKQLDTGYSNGIFQTALFFDDEELVKSFHYDILDVIQPETYVDIKVAGSWLTLFLDEVDTILQQTKLCNNCKKPLPLGSKLRYCPDKPENQDCNKERQRLRKATEREKAEYQKQLRSHK